MIEKRTQAERMTIAELMMKEIYEEMLQGHVERGLLQQAVDMQVYINRIVWKLNEKGAER